MAGPAMCFPYVARGVEREWRCCTSAPLLRPPREEQAGLCELAVDAGVVAVKGIMRFRLQLGCQILFEEGIELVGKRARFFAQLEVDRNLPYIRQDRGL